MNAIAMPPVDAGVIARRDEIIAALRAAIGDEHVIVSEDERRAYETDALTAYRAVPLAVVLPGSTEEVAAVLKVLSAAKVKVVARGAGTSLSGGALPSPDSVVVGLARLNRILAIDYDNRVARVETGVTNINITNAVSHKGFFYAPDPSSQLACTIGGNIAMNSGGAHCLKYGVTTNNILGLKMVLLDGTVLELGGAHLDAPGYDLLGLVIGSEGQLGVVTEATVRILRAAEGARPMLMGFASAEEAGGCVAAIIGSGIIPVALEYMDRPAIKVCEAFAHAGYPLDVEALLIIEVEGSEPEIADLIERINAIAKRFNPTTTKVSRSEAESAANGTNTSNDYAGEASVPQPDAARRSSLGSGNSRSGVFMEHRGIGVEDVVDVFVVGRILAIHPVEGVEQPPKPPIRHCFCLRHAVSTGDRNAVGRVDVILHGRGSFVVDAGHAFGGCQNRDDRHGGSSNSFLGKCALQSVPKRLNLNLI